MSKKTYRIIVGITGALCSAAIAIINILNVPNAGAICTVLGVLEATVAEVCSLFIKEDTAAIEGKASANLPPTA